MHRLVTDFFKYIHGFTRRTLKNCFAPWPALPGPRGALSDLWLNARGPWPVIFPLWHVALHLGRDGRWVWVQRGAGVGLLQAGGLAHPAVQQLPASFPQEADINVIAGFLQRKHNCTWVSDAFLKFLFSSSTIYWVSTASDSSVTPAKGDSFFRRMRTLRRCLFL